MGLSLAISKNSKPVLADEALAGERERSPEEGDGMRRLEEKPEMLISAIAVATLIEACVGVVCCCARCGTMLRLGFVFFHEPAESLTNRPNISHKLRPSLEEELKRGRKSLLYETSGVGTSTGGGGGFCFLFIFVRIF